MSAPAWGQEGLLHPKGGGLRVRCSSCFPDPSRVIPAMFHKLQKRPVRHVLSQWVTRPPKFHKAAPTAPARLPTQTAGQDNAPHKNTCHQGMARPSAGMEAFRIFCPLGLCLFVCGGGPSGMRDLKRGPVLKLGNPPSCCTVAAYSCYAYYTGAYRCHVHVYMCKIPAKTTSFVLCAF